MGAEYHEPANELSAETRDLHRAMLSLIEEVEAIDWYQQRIDVANDQALADILAHNRDEEMEHAAMTLEWLRRKMPAFDEALSTYLFTSEPILELEEKAEGGENGATSESVPHDTLGIGKFVKGK